MVPRLFAAAALVSGGCAQLIGADDPVAAFEVDPDIAGDYLLSIDATATTGLRRYEFFANVDNVDVDARTFDLTLRALRTSDRNLVGAELDFEGNSLGNNDTFGFTIDQFDLTIIDSATPDVPTPMGDVVLDAFLDAQFPILDGAHATTSGFCGVVTGAATTPETALTDVTFAAVKAEFPTSAPAVVSCADLQP